MKTTEQESAYSNIDSMSTDEILSCINQEDHQIAGVIKKVMPQISKLVDVVVSRIQAGGRLFYIGAGTSGRLGVLDASECPPTFGVPRDLIIALIAGGDPAIRNAVELAEDDEEQGWQDLLDSNVRASDVLVGIAASGSTPYVVGAVRKAREAGLVTGCVICNADSILATLAHYPIEIVTGPEFITGSTRMKAGTAQKLVLNMISTSVMIRLGKVRGSSMIHMQLTNKKLFERGKRMIMEQTGIDSHEAARWLKHHGSVQKVIDHLNQSNP